MASNVAEGAFYQGENKVLLIQVTDKSGASVDVAGWTFSYKIATTAKASTALLTKVSPEITVIGDFATGTQRVRIPFDDDETQEMRAKTYHHELKRTDEGEEAILFSTDFVLTQALHRA